MLNVPHAEVAAVLESAAAELPAAEAHGCLCGALCVNGRYTLADWLRAFVPDASQRKALAEPGASMPRLFDATVGALRGGAMEFSPLLPDDDATLADRTAALAQWVQGFLFGFAAGEPGRRGDLPDDVREVLRDFAEISRATPEPGVADGESDEAAYTELCEYVRVGVQLVHDELVPPA